MWHSVPALYRNALRAGNSVTWFFGGRCACGRFCDVAVEGSAGWVEWVDEPDGVVVGHGAASASSQLIRIVRCGLSYGVGPVTASAHPVVAPSATAISRRWLWGACGVTTGCPGGGIIAPPGIPDDVRNVAVNQTTASPTLLERFRAIGVEPARGTAELFAIDVRTEPAKSVSVVKRAGIKAP